jgi:hypothetical protein
MARTVDPGYYGADNDYGEKCSTTLAASRIYGLTVGSMRIHQYPEGTTTAERRGNVFTRPKQWIATVTPPVSSRCPAAVAPATAGERIPLGAGSNVWDPTIAQCAVDIEASMGQENRGTFIRTLTTIARQLLRPRWLGLAWLGLQGRRQGKTTTPAMKREPGQEQWCTPLWSWRSQLARTLGQDSVDPMDERLRPGQQRHSGNKELESCRGFLVYVTRTYGAMVPYLRTHAGDSWRSGRDADDGNLRDSQSQTIWHSRTSVDRDRRHHQVSWSKSREPGRTRSPKVREGSPSV